MSVTLNPEKERKSRGENPDNQYIIWVSSHVLQTGLFYLTWDSGNFCWRKVLTGPNSSCRRKINMCYLWATSALDNMWGCIRVITTTTSLMLPFWVTCAQEFSFFKKIMFLLLIFTETVISTLSFEKCL